MNGSRRGVSVLILLLSLLLGAEWEGTFGQTDDAEVGVSFVQPRDGETLQPGTITLIIKGTGFDFCWYADFFYRRVEEQDETLISHVVSKQNVCVLATEWDAQALPEGSYSLRVELLGSLRGQDHLVQAEILVHLGLPPPPSPPEPPEGPSSPEDTRPTALFRFEPTEPTTRDLIDFRDLSRPAPGRTIVRWTWDFGDGTTSSLQHPTHRYRKAGTYTVTLIVEDDQGLTDSFSTEITVREFVEIAVSRVIMAFPKLSEGDTPRGREEPDRYEILPGNVFRVVLEIKLQIDTMALSVCEGLRKLDEAEPSPCSLPPGWMVEKTLLDYEKPSFVDVQLRSGTLEWMIRPVGRATLPEGSMIRIAYGLRVPSDAEPNVYQFVGEVRRVGEGTRLKLPISTLEVADGLPIKMAIAHLRGRAGQECTAASSESCQVDPLFNPEHRIGYAQYRLAEGFWLHRQPVPYARPPQGETDPLVNSDVLLELFCYYQSETPVTEPCPQGISSVGLPVEAYQSIAAFPALPPVRGDGAGMGVPQVLPGNEFRVEVKVKAQVELFGFSLTQRFQDGRELPEGWDLAGWEPVLPPSAAVEVVFQRATLTWVFTGSISAGSEVGLRIRYRTPPLSAEAADYEYGLYRIEGSVHIRMGEAPASGDTWLRLVEAIPIRLALAHLTGEGCEATRPERCRVEPLFNEAHKITEAQWNLALNFWTHQAPVPFALGPHGERPAFVTRELLEELSCYLQTGLPVTEACSPPEGQPEGRSSQEWPKSPEGPWPIPYVIAHLKGEECGADAPDRCIMDLEDDDLIDDRQFQIAQDFWVKNVPVPYTAGPDGKPERITHSMMLTLICYYTKQIPVTEPCG